MRRLRLLLVLMLVTAVVLPANALAGTGWSEPAMFFVGGRMLAAEVDDDAAVHAVIARAGLWYVTEDGHRRIVRRSHARFDADIAVAADGDVFVAWVDRSEGDALWLTRRIAGAWTSSRVWLGKAGSPSVAIHGQGVGIAFRRGEQIRYLRWGPADGPSTARVVASDCCSGAASLVVIAGRPTIAYSAAYGGPLRVASRRASGVWRVETIDRRQTWSPDSTRSLNRAVIAYESGDSIWCVFSDGERCRGLSFGGAPPFRPLIAADSIGGVSISATTVEGAAGTVYYQILVRDIIAGARSQAVLVTRDNVIPDPRPPLVMVALGRVAGRAIVVFSSDDGFERDATTGHWVTRELG